jgi:hypothetical protein
MCMYVCACVYHFRFKGTDIYLLHFPHVQVVADVTPATGAFVFADVIPGTYTLSVPHEKFCWTAASQPITVGFEDVTNVVFATAGWVLPITASHDVTVHVVAAAAVRGPLLPPSRRLKQRRGRRNFVLDFFFFSFSELVVGPDAPPLLGEHT